jgi:hypothetical protein
MKFTTTIVAAALSATAMSNFVIVTSKLSIPCCVLTANSHSPLPQHRHLQHPIAIQFPHLRRRLPHQLPHRLPPRLRPLPRRIRANGSHEIRRDCPIFPQHPIRRDRDRQVPDIHFHAGMVHGIAERSQGVLRWQQRSGAECGGRGGCERKECDECCSTEVNGRGEQREGCAVYGCRSGRSDGGRVRFVELGPLDEVSCGALRKTWSVQRGGVTSCDEDRKTLCFACFVYPSLDSVYVEMALCFLSNQSL